MDTVHKKLNFKTSLYDYQIEAVQKLSPLKVGALYMEMGTGKTRVALSLIDKRLAAGKIDHIIWLCPFSVKPDLLKNIKKHTDIEDDLITICGIETLSSSVSANSRLLALAASKRCFLVVDESSLIKNPMALRTKNIIRLSSLCKYRLILNGTPISKNEADLFAQWYLLDWRILGYRSFWSFAANHIEYDAVDPKKIKKMLNVDYLTQKIEPYTFQVKKTDCLLIPPKKYRTVSYYMTESQDKIYEQTAEEYLAQVDEKRPETIYRMFGALQHVISGVGLTTLPDGTIKKYNIFERDEDNPRIEKLMDLLAEKGDEKVLIFCKYTHEINMIKRLLGDKAVEFYGELPPKKRQENFDRFSGDAQYMIANKKCAGFGLNMQFSHFEIFYSNDWDFLTRSQAEDREHRAGQTHEVTIEDILAEDTLDVSIADCLMRKQNLAYLFSEGLAKSSKKLADAIRGRIS